MEETNGQLTILPYGQADKLVFVALFQVSCHCETSAHTGRGNPPVSGEMFRIVPEKRGLLRFLAVIATWFHGAGGLPRQCAHWLAMTALFFKQQFAAVFFIRPEGAP